MMLNCWPCLEQWEIKDQTIEIKDQRTNVSHLALLTDDHRLNVSGGEGGQEGMRDETNVDGNLCGRSRLVVLG